MKSTLAIAIAAYLATTGWTHASEIEVVPTLPEGQVELTDVLTPEEIYSDILGSEDSDLDLGDLDASETDASDVKVYIYVSKARQHLWVYQNGQVLPGWDWKVSTGTEKLRCPPAAACRIAHTPTGRRNPGIMDWEHYSSLYGNAPMHRAIQFVGGVFLHATYGSHIAMLGRRDSGGCVRQHPANAEKLFLLVRDTVKKYGRKAVVIEITEN